MNAAPWTIALPLLGACGALLFTRTRWPRGIALAASGATIVAAVSTARGVWVSGSQQYAVGGWAAPLGIHLHLDGFAASMLLLATVAGLPLSVYAIGYYSADSRRAGKRWHGEEAFWPLWLVVLAALAALFLSADLFNVYVGLELLTLSAVALVALEHGSGAVSAATRYLLAAFLGSLSYLLGVALLYAETQALDMALIGERVEPTLAATAAVALMTAGLAVKSALFPLHFWLPRAHASAPAPVSAMLSGFVVAAAVYVLLRLWLQAFSPIVGGVPSHLMGVLGSAGIIWGAVQAIRQQRLKLMIAYSTVSQIGYFFLVLPLAVRERGAPWPEWSTTAWSGVIYLMATHAVAKASLFLAAGAITRSLGHDRIVGIRGISTHMPLTTFAFGLAGVSLIGLPPSGGFVGKWLLLSASLASGQWWWLVVIVVGSILTAGYVFVVLGQELSESRGDEQPAFAPVPRTMEYAALALALTSLLMGLRSIEPLALLRIGSPVATAMTVGG